jgi:uncharacterized membrane protein
VGVAALFAQLASCFLISLGTQQSIPPLYRAVVLDGAFSEYADAKSISEDGTCAGTVFQSSGVPTAAVWKPDGTLELIGRHGTESSSWATSINGAGTLAVGGAVAVIPGQFPVLWSLPTGGVQLPGTHSTITLAVNDSGDVLTLPSSFPSYGTLLLRSGRSYTIDGFIVGLSNDHRVAGMRLNGAGAFRWSIAGGFEELVGPPGFPQTLARGMGRDGRVVGMCYGGQGPFVVAWDLAGVPTLFASSLDGAQPMPLSVNRSGWLAGWEFGWRHSQDASTGRTYGSVWIGGLSYQLEDLLEPGSPVDSVPYAWALNDRGQIVGVGLVGGKQLAIRLDPL